MWTYRLQFGFWPQGVEAEHWGAVTKAWQTVSGIGGVLDEESRVISIHEVTEWWAAYVDAWPLSHVVQYPVNCNTEKCWVQGCSLDEHLMPFRSMQICFSRHELLLQYFHEGQRLNLWAHRGYLCCVEPSTVHDDPRSQRQLWCLGMPHLKVYWTQSGFLRVSRQRGRHQWLICPWWNLTAEACVSCQEVVVCKPRSHVRRLPRNWQECDGTVWGDPGRISRRSLATEN